MGFLKYGCILTLLLIASSSHGFTTQGSVHRRPVHSTWIPKPMVSISHSTHKRSWPLYAENDGQQQERRHATWRRLTKFVPFRKAIQKRWKPISFALLTALTLDRGSVLIRPPPAAHASTLPVMPQMEMENPEAEAIKKAKMQKEIAGRKELSEQQERSKKVGETQGAEARNQFDAEFRHRKAQEAAARKAGLNQLKRELLDQGISPDHDIEGERQVKLFMYGVDLATVDGTKYFAERNFEEKFPEESVKEQKKLHRFVLQKKIQDLKRRGVDPLEYYETHQEDVRKLVSLPELRIALIAKEYNENLRLYGQISVPVEGEELLSIEEVTPKPVDPKEAAAAAKARAKEEAAVAKQKARAEKEAGKAKAREEKAAAKQKAAEEKARLKEEKSKAKQAAAAAATATAGAAAAAAGAATEVAGDAVGAATDMASPPPQIEREDLIGSEVPITPEMERQSRDAEIAFEEGTLIDDPTTTGKPLPIVPAATVLVGVGAGGYAVKVVRDKSAAAEEERQRQFKLLMGDDTKKGNSAGGWTAPALEEVGPEVGPEFSRDSDKDDVPDTEPDAPPPAPAPKKRSRIKSMFSKKASDRETDLDKLVSPSAAAPEFAKLLAKILTFGAPGRFPLVVALPGDMPMKEFDLDAAKEMLIQSRASAGLTADASAEVFANVVNCMLIDIVDLASSALKEKDSTTTISAINIVVDFMNHAASLFDAVAPGVTITPVTYGGQLGRGKLEQMYGAYAMSAEGDTDRLELLQSVFSITDKKVEGIMARNMRKQVMEMLKGMKDGGMTPEMEEMMKGMGGMEGLAGLGGLEDGEAPSAEQVREMLEQLKKMKKDGMIPQEQLDAIRNEFKTLFGEGIDELMAKAKDEEHALTEEEKELMNLVNFIIEE